MILIIFDVIKHAQTRLIWACIFIFVKLSVMNMAWRIKKFLHALWFISSSSNHAVHTRHRLWTPNEAFFEISNSWAWADNLGKWICRHFGYFWPTYPHPFWYSESILPFYLLINHYFFKKKKVSLYIQISNIYFGLGFEFVLQRIRDLAMVCL